MNIIIGLLSGVCASMGLGGGFILLMYLSAFTEMAQIQAQGVNLAFFLPIALLSVILHFRNGMIDRKALVPFIIFGIIGAVIGAIVGINVDSNILRKLFAVLLIFVGLRELFHRKKKGDHS